MSSHPIKLLSLVPENLHEQVLLHWQAWQKTCEDNNLHSTIPYDLSHIGRFWACSEFVARTCIRYPEVFIALLENIGSQRSFSDYEYIVKKTLDFDFDEMKLMSVLRQLRQKEMLRIALRDLDELAPQKQILNELSDFAEAIVAQTLAVLHQERCTIFGQPTDVDGNNQKMLVIAMGKLGGRELNFSSDIDLIFCYPNDGETNGARKQSNQEFFVRLSQSLVKVLNEITADGFVYRVDTRLRPYGDSGAIVSSFAALESYYQQQGRDWERYAMIKAKVITGLEKDKTDLILMLKPFVYRRYLDYSAFESIREMKSMINAEVERKGIKDNIKLGRGGIREIEFIGQTFQLIRGGREVILQKRSIMAVLKQLSALKLLKKQDVNDLADAYNFHRKLENRIQMERDMQMHLLPNTELQQIKMTLAMGFQSWKTLKVEIELHRSNVNNIFQDILFSEKESKRSTNALNSFWFDTELDGAGSGAFEDWLTNKDISQADEIKVSLKRFIKDSHVKVLSEVATKRVQKLMIMVFDQLGSVQQSAIVFDRLLNILIAIVGRQVYISLLVEYPKVLQWVIYLCSCSDWFAKQLAAYPVLLDELIDPNYLFTINHKKDLVTELDYLLSGIKTDDLEQQMERLRHFKQTQVLKIAALDVKNEVDVKQVAHTLSNVAEVLCQKTLDIVWLEMVKKHGQPQCTDKDGNILQASMGIVAYGKMGGDELGYSSDLDVVFLHNSAGSKQMTNGVEGNKSIDNISFFVRVAQKFIHIMETFMHGGRLYEIDTRLRPDGRSGIMAVSLQAFENYQAEQAWTWEHQALIRARMIAGSEPIRAEFDRIRLSVLQQPQSSEKILFDVVEMREKMREHLSNKQAAFNIKQDVGGLVDIEFLAQSGVLCCASKAPQLLETTSTLQLLALLPDCGWLTRAESEQLMLAYTDYRWCVNRLALEISNDLPEQIDTKIDKHRIQVTNTWNRIMKIDELRH